MSPGGEGKQSPVYCPWANEGVLDAAGVSFCSVKRWGVGTRGEKSGNAEEKKTGVGTGGPRGGRARWNVKQRGALGGSPRSDI